VHPGDRNALKKLTPPSPEPCGYSRLSYKQIQQVARALRLSAAAARGSHANTPLGICSCVARVPHSVWSTTQRLPLLRRTCPSGHHPASSLIAVFPALGLRPARGPGVPWRYPMLGLRPARRLGGACTRTHRNIMILAAPTSSKRFAAIGWVASDPTPLLVCMVSMPP
jgi:hypothetical protein